MGLFKNIQIGRTQPSSGGGRRSLINVKKLFFDRQRVISALSAIELRVYETFGAFTRRDARKSMRKARRKKKNELSKDELIAFEVRERLFKQGEIPRPKRPFAPAAPGKPPRVITGVLKKFILFNYSPRSKSVVIGPTPTSQIALDAPRVLEEGGAIKSSIPIYNGKIMKPRPYMKPAFDKNLKVLDRIWRASIR